MTAMMKSYDVDHDVDADNAHSNQDVKTLTMHMRTQVVQRMPCQSRNSVTFRPLGVANAFALGQLATQQRKNAAVGLLICPAQAANVAYADGNDRDS